MLRNGLSFLKSFVIRSSVPGSGRSSGLAGKPLYPPPDFSPPRYDVPAAPGPSGSSLAGFRRGALPRLAALLLVLAALATPAFAQTTVPIAGALTPTGLLAEQHSTLRKRAAWPPDIATYNTFIQNLAAAGQATSRPTARTSRWSMLHRHVDGTIPALQARASPSTAPSPCRRSPTRISTRTMT